MRFGVHCRTHGGIAVGHDHSVTQPVAPQHSHPRILSKLKTSGPTHAARHDSCWCFAPAWHGAPCQPTHAASFALSSTPCSGSCARAGHAGLREEVSMRCGASSRETAPCAHQPLLALQSHLSNPALHTQAQVASLPVLSQRVLAVAPTFGQSASLQQALQANLPGEIWQLFRPASRRGTSAGMPIWPPNREEKTGPSSSTRAGCAIYQHSGQAWAGACDARALAPSSAYRLSKGRPEGFSGSRLQ